MLGGLEQLCDRDRLGQLDMFSLEQKRPWGHPIVTFQTSKHLLGNMWRNVSVGPVSRGQGEIVFN